ncbi:MAG: M20/M25/M40 family metallo-hydrolase [Proteobacteria bacterium]|nr:M20/M25/M40 family metallo-hydrolase [Pseudomonadota bacterium]
MNVLSDELRRWVDLASATVEDDELLDLTARMVDISSPTGEEREIAEFLVDFMQESGLEAHYQPIDANQGNAIARCRGMGSGPDLLFYAPLDTAFAGDPNEDEPWIDLGNREDQIPEAIVENGVVTGLGAHNPKGHGACAIMAAVALKRAGVPLQGNLTVGLAGGGMPTNHRAEVTNSQRRNIGHGSGCAFMLEQGIRGDFAIIAKPGPVSFEEVGLCWFRIRVKGVLGYAGTRHIVKHRNPIIDAAKIVDALEAWFPEYTARNSSGTVGPQGSIGCIRAGWPNKPTFIPEACDIYLDLRVNPRTDPVEVKRQFGEAMAMIGDCNKEIDLDWEMILAIPGSHTDRDNWVVQSTIRAWQEMTGTTFHPGTGGSGATEANILRAWGVPTARIGLPPPPELLAHAGMFSMGEVHVESLAKLTKALITAAVDTCGRSVGEVGLNG